MNNESRESFLEQMLPEINQKRIEVLGPSRSAIEVVDEVVRAALPYEPWPPTREKQSELVLRMAESASLHFGVTQAEGRAHERAIRWMGTHWRARLRRIALSKVGRSSVDADFVVSEVISIFLDRHCGKVHWGAWWSYLKTSAIRKVRKRSKKIRAARRLRPVRSSRRRGDRVRDVEKVQACTRFVLSLGELPSREGSPEELVAIREEVTFIQEALDALPRFDQVLLEERYLWQHSYELIGRLFPQYAGKSSRGHVKQKIDPIVEKLERDVAELKGEKETDRPRRSSRPYVSERFLALLTLALHCRELRSSETPRPNLH